MVFNLFYSGFISLGNFYETFHTTFSTFLSLKAIIFLKTNERKLDVDCTGSELWTQLNPHFLICPVYV